MLLNYHIGRLVLSSCCVGDFVRLVLGGASACKTNTTQNQPHQSSNTQRTENKTTDVVIQQYSRKLRMMDILMSETCWAHKKWNKIAIDIKLVFHFSTVLTEFVIPMKVAAHEHCIGRMGSMNLYSFLNNTRFTYCSFKACDDGMQQIDTLQCSFSFIDFRL